MQLGTVFFPNGSLNNLFSRNWKNKVNPSGYSRLNTQKNLKRNVETLRNAVASWAQLAVAQDLAADDFRILDGRFDHQSRMRSAGGVNRFSGLKKQAAFC
jgi:hypothetical protein